MAAAWAGRDYDASISPATLHDVVLPPFVAGMRAGAGSIMASFNTLNGVPMHANRTVITELFRRNLGFDGLVVADYTGILELIAHGTAADRAHAARLGLSAGVDMDMVSETYTETLEESVRTGLIDEAEITAACRRVLEAKLNSACSTIPITGSTGGGPRSPSSPPPTGSLPARRWPP
jgi:Beta-glucosidase-related glycosidases